MDILNILREGIEKLPAGEFQVGLQAVVNHIEVAIRHLETAQSSGDSQYYTDAIYRCNQAFEGSLKELYRVLSGKDPTKTTPNVIEKFLIKGDVLRPKVISQMTRYRQEWRNPSTHDYMLDFDENESFLAIVNISAFAKVAVAQIASKIAFDKASTSPRETEKAEVLKLEKTAGKTRYVGLTEDTAILAKLFLQKPNEEISHTGALSESLLASSLGGFMSSMESWDIVLEAPLGQDSGFYADMLIRDKGEVTLVELKKLVGSGQNISRMIQQMSRYMQIADLRKSVLVAFQGFGKAHSVIGIETPDGEVYVICPSDQLQTFSSYNPTVYLGGEDS